MNSQEQHEQTQLPPDNLNVINQSTSDEITSILTAPPTVQFNNETSETKQQQTDNDQLNIQSPPQQSMIHYPPQTIQDNQSIIPNLANSNNNQSTTTSPSSQNSAQDTSSSPYNNIAKYSLASFHHIIIINL